MATAINSEAEQKAIITILNVPEMSAHLLGTLGLDHFGDDASNEILARVLKRIQAGKEIPKREIMVTHASLSDQARQYLENIDVKPIKSKESCDQLIEVLQFHRKIRMLLRAVTEIKDSCKVATPETMHELESKIDQLTLDIKSHDNAPKIITFGQGDRTTSDEVVARLMSNDKTGFIPTGFPYFDGRAGGFRKGHAVLIAGPTGGGKSALANQLLVNMYMKAHLRTMMVSFEMRDDECTGRMVATCKEMEHSKIEARQLTPQDAKKIFEWKKEFDQIGIDHECWFKLWNPDSELTASNVISYMRPLAPDVIVVDYIGLLSQDDPRDDQWLALGNAMRQFKLAANKLNCCIIVLAQFDQENFRVKYSRALREHANIHWSWMYGLEEQATGDVVIRQMEPFGKNRNCQPFDFKVKFRLKFMRIDDGGEVDPNNLSPAHPSNKAHIKPDKAVKKLPVARTTPGLIDD